MSCGALRLLVSVLAAAAVAGTAMAGAAAPALATAPYWALQSTSAPTNLPPGGEGKVIVTASNLGDAAMEGGTAMITVTDKLPPGLTATSIFGARGSYSQAYRDGFLRGYQEGFQNWQRYFLGGSFHR